MDKAFNRVFKNRVPNHLERILQTLAPFQDQIKGFVVESTYNWYQSACLKRYSQGRLIIRYASV
jgi:hypothetical protein